ncbi:MAG: tyrosine-protein phosphatase [Tannerella sp.]|nr:tyrosine-protein phosphatase [Tannerella sp.]
MKTLITIIMAGIASVLLGSCNKSTSSRGTYEGKDISNEAEIIRDKQTRSTTLNVKTDGKWKIYAGSHVETIDHTKPILEGQGKGSFELNIPTKERYYFQFITNEGKAILGERHLPIQGGYNFRDLGGLKTKDDRFVKWGKIFRSDDLYKLTDDDLAYLSSIPVISVVDFRSEKEIGSAPDKLPATAQYYPYTITPGSLPTSADISGDNLEALQALNIDSIMQNINELLVTNPSSVRRYTDLFQLMEDKTNVPLLFHCSAGKDRTGMGTALFLFALGVDEETILNDYLLSNKYIKEKYAKYTAQHPSLEPLFSVKPEYLKAGIKKIKDEYGSIDNYLDKVLKVDREKLKEMYLY